MMTDALVLLHAGATLMMAGLIWFVQVVHYPLFARLHPSTSVPYAVEHMRRTTWVVAPLMLVEAATAAALLLLTAGSPLHVPAWIGVALLVVIWGATGLLCVPCHTRLADGFDGSTVARLVRMNWIRTIAWTGRAVLALWFVAGSITIWPA
jgi:hypothetical protein